MLVPEKSVRQASDLQSSCTVHAHVVLVQAQAQVQAPAQQQLLRCHSRSGPASRACLSAIQTVISSAMELVCTQSVLRKYSPAPVPDPTRSHDCTTTTEDAALHSTLLTYTPKPASDRFLLGPLSPFCPMFASLDSPPLPLVSG